MKILDLKLLAFGPFADRVLDFSRTPGALQIVYGPNEAGKSTCLRAVEALLFGFERDTRDAHLHPTDKLRVGGRLEGPGGRVLEVVRRKRLKGSLRDAADQPIDEAELTSMLHGVDRALFRALYGLDHVRLREGARALLDARGGLGESLFEAGLAGAGVAKLSRQLKEEAEELWSPTARKRPLAESLRAYTQAKIDERRFATTHGAFQAQEDAIAGAQTDRDEADAAIKELGVEERRLERGIKLAPRLRARRAALRERSDLGDVVLLAEGARAEREAAAAIRAEAAALVEQAHARMSELRAALAALGDAPRDVDEAMVRELASALGEVRRELRLADALAAERTRLDVEADETQLDAGVELDERAVLAAVRERDTLEREVASVRGALASARARLTQAEAGIASHPEEEVSLAELERAIEDAARTAARGAEAVEARKRAAKSRAAVAVARASLPGCRDGALGAMPVPGEAEAASWSRDLEKLAASLSTIRDEEVRTEARIAGRERERGILLATGDVPTEAQLFEARRLRDEAIAALDRPEATPDRSGVPALVRAADELADRLRREAERATRLATIDAELDEARARAQSLAVAKREARDQVSAIREACRRAFEGAGVRPAPEVEAAGPWLVTWRTCVAELAAVEEAEALVRTQADAERAAAATLSALGGRADATELNAELARARSRLEARRQAEAARSAWEEASRDARSEAARLEGELAKAERLVEGGRSRATPLLAALGLDPAATTDLVSSRLEALAKARGRVARKREIATAMDAARRAVVELQRITARSAAAVGVAVPEGEAVAAAEALLATLEEARRASEVRRSLARQLDEQVARGTEARDRLAGAEATLAALAGRAGVPVAELPEAERRSARARELDAIVRGHDETIAALADGAPLDELEAQLLSLDVDEATERLDAVAENKSEAERRKDLASQAMQTARMGLARFDESQAADHAALAEQHLARARPLFDKYVRLRVASRILEREIESYSRAHQGPVLARAAELFERLTEGSFQGLSVALGDGDRPELVCVRGREEVGVEALSDGTRDQLYLALRLATIERHAERAEAMPLVLDDVLVHFDDPRSRAALAALADVAPKVQVLLFTHHARVVELAREAVPPGRLGVVALSASDEHEPLGQAGAARAAESAAFRANLRDEP